MTLYCYVGITADCGYYLVDKLTSLETSYLSFVILPVNCVENVITVVRFDVAYCN